MHLPSDLLSNLLHNAPHAVPEHLVVETLLPDIKTRQIAVEDALARIRAWAGWVPVAVCPGRDDDEALLYFADLGQLPCDKWQHIYSLKQLAENGTIGDYFSTSFKLLKIPGLLPDPITPRGFILHMSRCGSTLLGKALARADGVAVINQPAPLQYGLWAQLSGQWQNREELALTADPLNALCFKNLIHLLCRERIPGERTVFIKFISWNALYVDFIRSAFPDVACLFLYRDPVEVMSSVALQTTAALVAKPHALAEFLSGMERDSIDCSDATEYLAACYANYFASILNAKQPPVLVGYQDMTRTQLPSILAAVFGYTPSSSQLQQMQAQFAFYSKDDADKTDFKPDSRSKQNALESQQIARIRARCQALLETLDAHRLQPAA
ncbi:MAG: hypothetical protein RQ899_01415 [Pseudomonadales bacterium]|nr:hypothetical protein [Pseudomonadales bacterium]